MTGHTCVDATLTIWGFAIILSIAFWIGRGNLRRHHRNHPAQLAPQRQQPQADDKQTDDYFRAEFDRIAAELEIPYDWKQQGS